MLDWWSFWCFNKFELYIAISIAGMREYRIYITGYFRVHVQIARESPSNPSEILLSRYFSRVIFIMIVYQWRSSSLSLVPSIYFATRVRYAFSAAWRWIGYSQKEASEFLISVCNYRVKKKRVTGVCKYLWVAGKKVRRGNSGLWQGNLIVRNELCLPATTLSIKTRPHSLYMISTCPQ